MVVRKTQSILSIQPESTVAAERSVVAKKTIREGGKNAMVSDGTMERHNDRKGALTNSTTRSTLDGNWMMSSSIATDIK